MSEGITEAIEQCYRNGWTDGLPVIPPTEELVQAMVTSSGLQGDAVVATLGPAKCPATVLQVAANAVMAGCTPECLPVVLASVKLAEPMFAGGGVTIHSAAPMLLINGPARDLCGFNYRGNALGSGNRANATVGRALRLVLQNLGGIHNGGMDAATLGHPGKYTYCFAEHEAASPWQPLHVDRGFAREESTVTLHLADAPLCLAHMGTEGGEPVLSTIADALPIAGTYNIFFQHEVFIVFSPEHAELVAGAGFTKDDVRGYLFEHARRRAGGLLDKGMFGFASETMGPAWLKDPRFDPEMMAPVVNEPGRITPVVAGREVGGYSAVIFGAGNSMTAKIELEAHSA